jgi:glycosyltransferase involved in cell wall biosynthesis
MSDARIVVGIPSYNNARHARRAIESLLVQTHPNIAFVGCDDGSSDGTAEILEEYAARDPRFTFQRNSERLGMVRNWCRVFERARELHPSMEYFAWGSDHDVWHPAWARTLATELDAHPEAVLAYPLALGVWDDDSQRRVTRPFETAGESSIMRRLHHSWRRMAAGTMVYGLFRAGDLEACGVYRMILLPDRLLISELAVRGEFRQVQSVLWHRRLREGVVKLNARQRAAFFPGRRAPLYMRMPWALQHTAVLAWQLGVRPRGAQTNVSRLLGLRIALAYLRVGITIEVPRALLRNRLRLKRWVVPRFRKLRKRTAKQLGLTRARELPAAPIKVPKPDKPEKAVKLAKAAKASKPAKAKKGTKPAKSKRPKQSKTGVQAGRP